MIKKTLILIGIIGSVIAQDPYVFLDIEPMYLKRGGSARKVLAGSGTTAPYTTQIRSKSLASNLGYQPGVQVSIGAHNNDKGGILRAFIAKRWESKKSVTMPNQLNFPFNSTNYAPGYYNADQVTATYHSNLTLLDAYYTKEFTPLWKQYFAVEGLFGAQYFSLPDTVKLDYTSNGVLNTYSSTIHNRLGLVAFGLFMQIRPSPLYAFEFRGIGGVGAAWYHSETLLKVLGNTVNLRSADTHMFGACYSFLGTARFTYRPSEHFEMSLGYELIYMDRISLPYQQMSYNTLPTSDRPIHHSKDGYAQGVGFRMCLKL